MSLKLSELKNLHAKGLALIYLRPKEKRPFEMNWTTSKPKSWDELENSFEKSYNLGVRLGEASHIKDQGYLACVDVDIKDPRYKKRALEELSKITNGKTFPEVRSGSGNGSRHLYCVTKEPFKMVTVVKEKGKFEICLYSTGRQMALPPSIHPDTGMEYAWHVPMGKSFPVINPFQFSKQEVVAKSDREETKFQAMDVNLYDSRLPVRFIKMIETGENCEDRSASLMSISMAMCRAGFTDNQILSVLSDEAHWISGAAFEHTQSRSRDRAVKWLDKYTLTKARYETSVMRFFDNPPGDMKPLSKKKAEKVGKEIKSEPEDWRHSLQHTEKGGYKQSLTNVELILSNVQAPNVFVHDSFSTRDSYGMNTPWGGKKGNEMGDIDLTKIRRWLSGSSFAIEPSKELTLEAVKFIADRNKVHPVREWLKGLKWDGTERVNTWIKTYLKGKAPEPYRSEVGRLFLLAMVKRVFEPGCQWDYTLVLEGKQGTYKSSTARALAGDTWFMDNLPDLRDKDVMLNLQGKWVIELGELADVKRGDYNLVKAYLNRRVDRVRSPYDRLPQDTPRQSVFIGTVNEGEYLKDPTGNRRFWPVRVGVCNVEALRRDRDQLFAEVMWIYENCFSGKLMLSAEATVQANEAQEDRRIEDDSTQMKDVLLEYIEAQQNLRKGKRFDFYRFKIRQLFAVGMPWEQWAGKGWAFNTAAQVLSNTGYKKRTIQGQRYWGLKGARGGASLL